MKGCTRTVGLLLTMGSAFAFGADDLPSDKRWIYGKVAELYRDSCSGCHGRNFEGGKGPSLVAPTLRHGSDDDSVASSIRSGFPETGMPAFGATLSAADIRTLVIYLRERRQDGPRGGDEINIIRRGHNYGWPVITYGMEYDGTPISDKTAQEGMDQPVTYWTPSIAVCGIVVYEGKAFPKWRHNLFATALAQQELRRLVIDGGKIVHQEVLVKDIGRLRDVVTGPDGYLYIAINFFDKPGRIVRLVPVK